ncbi:N-acetylated-alpha-linked acidic dipeptidase 2 [Nymphon striatum]|nr:N-acetylated-alpha-linked acidic dipeptidase 2 [Nymphon striatum]
MAQKAGIVITLCLIVGVFAFSVGILIGYFSHGGSRNGHGEPGDDLDDAASASASFYKDGDYISEELKSRMKAENMRDNLMFLSAEPHLAGSERDNYLAKYIKDRWEEYGVDQTKLVPYEVVLSFPDSNNPNKVRIESESGETLFESQHKEKTLRPEDEHPNFIHAFNSYSPAGDIKGDLVYVNFGRVEDFDALEEMGVSVEGKICIMRYGKIYRGNKVKHAEDRKAIGAILYLDPEEVALNGTSPENVYPNSWWMPGTAMQRGTVSHGHGGDPSTPGYPTIDGVYRIPEDEYPIPTIPVQPIGYSDAMEFLKIMAGPAAKDGWKGKLPIEYKLGPGFQDEHVTKKVRIIVNNKLKITKSNNVFGVIKGAVEPDRYVLIGNHRDSWGYGAVDATTGTSQLLEVARVLGELKSEGWKPRRTIIFCSWGAEEYGLIGSYEWVEVDIFIHLENLPKLQDRAVAYINVDICTSGDALDMNASPLLFDVAWDVTKMVPDPKVEDKTVYDIWKMRYQNKSMPEITFPGSGTDHAAFTFYAGVPIINMWWKHNKEKFDISIYPAYHTGYETFYLVDKFIDPGFKIHKSCSQISALMLHKIADSKMLPFNATRLAEAMIDALKKLKEKIGSTLQTKNLNLDKLEGGLSKFKTSAMDWHKSLKEVDKEDTLKIRILNDQFMTLERVFIKPDGLPDSPTKRHMIFAPSKFDSYSGGAYPALSDLMYGIENLTGDEAAKRWLQVERHLSDLLIVIHYATEILKPAHVL